MKKTCKQTALALAAALTVTSVAPASVMQAAAVKNLNKASITKAMTVGVGCKKTIAVTKVPKKTKISYVSKNKKIATVSKKGVVKAKKTGSTVINVKLTYNKKTTVKKCKVTVKSITLKNKTVTLNVGATYQITKKNKVAIKPAKALQTVSYTSSNKKVATVTSKGKVTTKKEGTAKVTIKAQDGSEKKTVLTVKVKKAVEPTAAPSTEPTVIPSTEPTAVPSTEPTAVPSTEPTVVPSTEPTAVPSTEPTVVPSTEPTAVPSTEPTAIPSTEPTLVPSTEPTAPVGTTKIITAADIVNGKAEVSGSYDNVEIDTSVGNAEITLDNITIKNMLTLNYGAGYTVYIKKADIANVEIVQKAVAATQNVKVFAAEFEQNKVPTIVIADETVITDVKVTADVKITGSSKGQISNVTIATKSNIEIAAPVKKVTVAKEASATALLISATVEEIQVEAANTELKVEQTGKVTKVETAETATGTIMEVAGTVESVKADGAEAVIKGTGKITEVAVNGNNTVIEGIVSEKIAVSEQVTGTTVNNNSVAGGSTVSTTPSGGNTGEPDVPTPTAPSGGNNSGGGSYVPTPSTPTPSTPTPIPETARAEKTFTLSDTEAKFKVTKTDGKVEIYTINKDDLRGYYHNPATNTTISYTKTSYDNGSSENKTVEGITPVVTESLKKASIMIEGFTCTAEVSLANGKANQCKVTVTTTDTTVDNIEFITNYVQKVYTKDNDAVTLTADTDTYVITYADLDKLYDAAVGSTVTIAYTKNSEQKNESVEKKENNKGSFTVDGIRCETWIDIDRKEAYVTVTATDTAYTTFTLS